MWVILPGELFWTMAIWSHLALVGGIIRVVTKQPMSRLTYNLGWLGVIYTWVSVVLS